MPYRVAAFTTVHYRPDLLQYFDRVMRNLAEFRVSRMHLTVVTNVAPSPEFDVLDAMCRVYFGRADYQIASFPNCDPPFSMTWRHKPILREMAGDPSRFTHFIYLEDDIGLTYRNFEYFTEFVEELRAYGLIPSFLRTEFANGRLVVVDSLQPTIGPRLVSVPGQTFAQQRWPFCACFVMDRTHIGEYLASRSFDMERSTEVSDWGLPERSSQGLCRERVPPGFIHRYMLPVDDNLVPLPMCHISHMSNKLSQMPDVAFGRMPIDSVFIA